MDVAYERNVAVELPYADAVTRIREAGSPLPMAARAASPDATPFHFELTYPTG